MKHLNRWMLYISLFTIILATTIAILAIWQVVIDTEFVWKSLMTLGVIFLASLLTYTVNNLIPADTEASEEQRDN
jgi:hypothetical protein